MLASRTDESLSEDGGEDNEGSSSPFEASKLRFTFRFRCLSYGHVRVNMTLKSLLEVELSQMDRLPFRLS